MMNEMMRLTSAFDGESLICMRRDSIDTIYQDDCDDYGNEDVSARKDCTGIEDRNGNTWQVQERYQEVMEMMFFQR